MTVKEPPVITTEMYERRARAWDRWVTVIIVLLLFVPLPFVRFESWPDGAVLFDRPVLPWSRFHVCYVKFPEGEPVEEVYGFTWKGKIISEGVSSDLLFILNPADSPLLKWQNSPEVVLRDVFLNGDFIQVRTFWQPVLLWPVRMGMANRFVTSL